MKKQVNFGVALTHSFGAVICRLKCRQHGD